MTFVQVWMASFHDPDYVAVPKTSLPSEATAARRAVAMQQWMIAKTDHDYIKALTRMLRTQRPDRRADRTHRTSGILASLPASKRKECGADLPHRARGAHPGLVWSTPPVFMCELPLLDGGKCSDASGTVANVPSDPTQALLLELTHLDVNRICQSIQKHDPLSWHCPKVQQPPSIQGNTHAGVLSMHGACPLLVPRPRRMLIAVSKHTGINHRPLTTTLPSSACQRRGAES